MGGPGLLRERPMHVLSSLVLRQGCCSLPRCCPAQPGSQ